MDSEELGYPGSGLRERNKREKLARILSAARESFATKGFADTTLRDVAVAASIGTGTLFLYVKTKEDLLCLVFKRELTPVINQSFETLPQADLRTQLLHLFGAVTNHHAENLSLSRPFLKEFTFVGEPVASEISEFMGSWTRRIGEVVEAAKTRGEIAADIDVAILSASALRLFMGALRVWVAGRSSREELDRVVSTSLGLLLKGLGPAADGKSAEPRRAPRKARQK